MTEAEVRKAIKWYDRISPGQMQDHEKILLAVAKNWLDIIGVEELEGELEKSKWFFLGESFGGKKAPTGREISKRQAEAIRKRLIQDSVETT